MAETLDPQDSPVERICKLLHGEARHNILWLVGGMFVGAVAMQVLWNYLTR